MTIYDLDIDRAVVAIPGVETYRRTSDGLWVTPLLGQVASIDGVTEALLGSDGSTAAQFPSRVAPSGPLRRGFYFDGGDQLNLGNSNRFSFTDGVNDLPFSIVFMCVVNSIANRAFVSKTITTLATGEYIFPLVIAGTTRIYFYTIDNSTGGRVGRYGIPGIVEGVPIVLAGTYSGNKSATGFKIYKDGVRFDTVNEVSGVYNGMQNTAASLVTGGSAGGSYAQFLGSMLVPPIIYPFELSPVEVGVITARMQSLYANTPVR